MRAGVVLLVLLGLGLLYMSMKPATPSPNPVVTAASARVETPAADVAAAKPAAPVAAEPRTLEWRVQNGRVQQAPASLAVQQGELLRLSITSDRADQLHLHGYDRALALKPGVPAVLELTADHSGRFDLELHHSGLELGALEVQPR